FQYLLTGPAPVPGGEPPLPSAPSGAPLPPPVTVPAATATTAPPGKAAPKPAAPPAPDSPAAATDMPSVNVIGLPTGPPPKEPSARLAWVLEVVHELGSAGHPSG